MKSIKTMKKNSSKKIDVAIVGAGYVGLTLAIYMAKKGSNVVVIDNDLNKIDQLNMGNSTIFEEGLQQNFLEVTNNGRLQFSSSKDIIATNWILAISYFPGDVEKFMRVFDTINPEEKKAPVIMIRGTIPVGYAKNHLMPELEKKFNGKLDESFYLSTAPERTLSGDAMTELEELPQLIGGTKISTLKSEAVYNKVGISCIKLPSLESGELAKTFTNFSRLVQFNLSNYLGSLCQAYGINDKIMINALKEGYPRINFLSSPGPGVGGFCLPKDSLVLYDAFSEFSNNMPESLYNFPKDQFNLNQNIIEHHYSLARNLLKDSKNILAFGLAFKGIPQTDDTRDSIGLKIAERLFIDKFPIKVFDRTIAYEDLKKYGMKIENFEDNSLKEKYDTILILNNDDYYKKLIGNNLEYFEYNIKIYDPWRILVSTEQDIIQTNFITENLVSHI